MSSYFGATVIERAFSTLRINVIGYLGGAGARMRLENYRHVKLGPGRLGDHTFLN